MELEIGGQYAKFYKKYIGRVVSLFCEGLKWTEVSDELLKEFGETVPYQSLVNVYTNNRDYFEKCKSKKLEKNLEDLKEELAIDYVKKKAIEVIFIIDNDDLHEKVKSLSNKQQLDLMSSMMNFVAKCEGLDKSEININNHSVDELLTIFSDDLNWE